MPRALMSSSTSGQWAPSPSPMISNRARCSGVASDSRHDHASGTLTVRPSVNRATMASSVTSSVAKRGSLLPAVFIPCLPNAVQIVEDDLPDAVQFLPREAVVVGQGDWLEPELADGPVSTHV